MLPHGNRILNSKEKKKLLAALKEQFGIETLPTGIYIQNNKDKVQLITRDLERIDIDHYPIDSLGLYFGAWHIDGFRPSIEGTQLIATQATKGRISLNKYQRDLWLKGNDISWDSTSNDFVIITYGNDVLGCGKQRTARDGKEPILLNYTPKARRLVVVND